MSTTPHKSQRGRKSEYTDEIGDEICARIMTGESLIKICKKKKDEDNDMPYRSTFYRWLRENLNFAFNYQAAKAESAHADMDRLDEIVDDVLSGTISPSAGKVAASIIQWNMGKKNAKVYGNLVTLEDLVGKDKIAKIEIVEVKKDKDEKEE